MTTTHVTIIGNATRDPELRYTHHGTPVTNITIAVSHRRKNPTTGQWEDDNTTFYQAQSWKKEAEHVCQSVRKGDRVIAIGDLRREEWEDKNGQVRDRLLVLNAEIGLSTKFTAVRTPPKQTGVQEQHQDAQNSGYTPAGVSQTGWVVQDTRSGFQTPQNGTQGFSGQPPATTTDQPPF